MIIKYSRVSIDSAPASLLLCPLCELPMAQCVLFTRVRGFIFPVPCVDDVISGTGFVRADTCSSRHRERIARRDPSRDIHPRVCAVHSHGFYAAALSTRVPPRRL